MQGLRILVVGDLMVDRYLWGDVDRVSPEAPVPIVQYRRSESRPGGAANVALNLKRLGVEPMLVGLIGEDESGASFNELLAQHGLAQDGVLMSAERPTTTKTRIIGNGHQMLRLDHEDVHPLSTALTGKLEALIHQHMAEAGAVVFQDYDKGVLSTHLIQTALGWAREQGLPSFADPKHRHFFSFGGVRLFKPNLNELNAAMGIELDVDDTAGITAACVRLREDMPHTETMVTLSAGGALLVDAEGRPLHVPAQVRSVRDVSGAGDTVLSVMAAARTAGWSAKGALALANLAGGQVCEQVGVVPLDAARLAREAAERELAGS